MSQFLKLFKKVVKKIAVFFDKKAGRIEKRFRLMISVIILSTLMLFSTFFFFDKAIFFLPLLIFTTYFLTYFSLLEGIKNIGWFSLFFMPITVTVSFYLFYFLFPIRWLTRLPFIIIYSISIYANLLTSNIFNVGVEKSLQLYRAAFSVNFLYQAIVGYLLFNFLFSLKQIFLINVLGGGTIAFLLAFHLFWSIRLKKYIEREVLNYSLLVGIILAQLAFIISFMPANTTIASLFLTASYYSLGGIFYNFLDQRLFKETIREYVVVWLFVLVVTFLSLNW